MKVTSPRQNRVDPWSRIVATPARGLLMGNRGNLHDEQGRIKRDYQVTRWIICLLEFRGRKRTLMQPGHYTELFFLDEATALAAGHRPCAECQRARYELFLDFWAKTQGRSQGDSARPRAHEVDAALHVARWAGGRKRTYRARLGDLPSGAMVAALDDDAPLLIWQGQLWRWDFTGYRAGPPYEAASEVRVLTPKPVVEILAAGYPLQLHPSLLSPPPSSLESGSSS
jgi:hypothetical protein